MISWEEIGLQSTYKELKPTFRTDGEYLDGRFIVYL